MKKIIQTKIFEPMWVMDEDWVEYPLSPEEQFNEWIKENININIEQVKPIINKRGDITGIFVLYED